MWFCNSYFIYDHIASLLTRKKRNGDLSQFLSKSEKNKKSATQVFSPAGSFVKKIDFSECSREWANLFFSVFSSYVSFSFTSEVNYDARWFAKRSEVWKLFIIIWLTHSPMLTIDSRHGGTKTIFTAPLISVWFAAGILLFIRYLLLLYIARANIGKSHHLLKLHFSRKWEIQSSHLYGRSV